MDTAIENFLARQVAEFPPTGALSQRELTYAFRTRDLIEKQSEALIAFEHIQQANFFTWFGNFCGGKVREATCLKGGPAYKGICSIPRTRTPRQTISSSNKHIIIHLHFCFAHRWR